MPVDRRSFLKGAGATIALPALVRPAWAGAPDVVSLAKFQTDYRNQFDRDSCYAFGTCAAIEAAYKRKYGLDLHLSEQYAYHINKVTELYPDYLSNRAMAHENNSSYWGSQGSVDLVRKLAACAVPEAAAAPYLRGRQMTALKRATPACGDLEFKTATQEQVDAFEFLEAHVPITARHVARYRVTAWEALPPQPSPSHVENVLAGGNEVIAAFQWGPGAVHVPLIIGYDRPKQQWLVKNSWGEGRPILVPYDKPILIASYATDVAPPDAEPQRDAWWLGRWHMDHDGRRGELVIRRTVDFRSRGGPTKLGNYYADGGRFDVNGTAVEGGRGLNFWIADTQDRVKPGERRGQEFVAYTFSADPYAAAGLTFANGTEYGVRLNRSDIGTKPTGDFTADAWRGNWSVLSDGLRGILSVASVAPWRGSFRTEGDETHAVTGSLDTVHPHRLDVQIGAAGRSQRLRLAIHNRESDAFSGDVLSNGRRFGVLGDRLGVGLGVRRT
jgi:TAT (twin-arginine translocation) pathway signal sequence